MRSHIHRYVITASARINAEIIERRTVCCASVTWVAVTAHVRRKTAGWLLSKRLLRFNGPPSSSTSSSYRKHARARAQARTKPYKSPFYQQCPFFILGRLNKAAGRHPWCTLQPLRRPHITYSWCLTYRRIIRSLLICGLQGKTRSTHTYVWSLSFNTKQTHLRFVFGR